ncbi:MAG: hypothetical protein KC996_02715 [Phycisphaerales bacterium]|nr:hypothetical protein [Phycisphaerales bacterium]
MGTAKLSHCRVIRYAPDGGYSPGEWQHALENAEFSEPIGNGETQRLGVQITKTRAIDIIVRLELPDGPIASIAQSLGLGASDRLFRSPSKCRKQVRDAERPLAVLGGKFGDRSARVLVCEAHD